MALTPDETRVLPSTECSVCGKHIPVNRRAIIYENRHTGEASLIADCCADEYLGTLIQDYARALTEPPHQGAGTPCYWIRSTEDKALRIINALRRAADAYESAIPDFKYRDGGKGK